MTTPATASECKVRGWTWRPDGTSHGLASWSDVEAACAHDDARTWVDVESPSRADVKKIDAIIDLDKEAEEDCIKGPERPRIDEYDDHFALFLFGVLSANTAGRFTPRRVCVFCDTRHLVTVHAEPMFTIGTLHKRCKKQGAKMFAEGIDVVLYRFVDTLVDNYLVLLDQFDDELDQLEVDSIDARKDGEILKQAARMRKALIEVRRLAAAQRALLTPIVRGEFDYVSQNLSDEFRHVEEHLVHTLDRVEGMRERLSGALQNYYSTLAERTNDIVRILTIFSAVLMPLTLIAGVYGMNVPIVWPPGNHPGSFWGLLAAMGVFGVGLLLFFRTRRWF